MREILLWQSLDGTLKKEANMPPLFLLKTYLKFIFHLLEYIALKPYNSLCEVMLCMNILI